MGLSCGSGLRGIDRAGWGEPSTGIAGGYGSGLRGIGRAGGKRRGGIAGGCGSRLRGIGRVVFQDWNISDAAGQD